MSAKLNPNSSPIYRGPKGIGRERLWVVRGAVAPDVLALWSECKALAIECWRAEGTKGRVQGAPLRKRVKRPSTAELARRAMMCLKRSLMVTCRRLELPAHAICDAARIAGNHERLPAPELARLAAKEGVDGPTWLAGRLDIEAQTIADLAEERRRTLYRAKRMKAFRKGKPDPLTGEVRRRPGRPSKDQIAARTRVEQREFLGESGGSAGWGVD